MRWLTVGNRSLLMFILITVSLRHPMDLRTGLIVGIVGGDILEAALARAKPHSRFVMCGAISTYNNKNASGLKVCGLSFQAYPLY